MKHCRKCQLIYDEHSSTCDRCDGPLKHYEPGHDIHHMNIVFPEGAEWVILESVLEEYEAQSHVDYLKTRHVPALKVLNQKGVLSEVYLGRSVFGYDVFVPEKIFEEAREKLDEYLNAPLEEFETTEESETTEE